MLEDDPTARDLIARALGRAVDDAVKEHLSGISQEPQITSRIGQKLEQVMDAKRILGHQVSVITQDIPDRGPKSLESKIGADLYVGISVDSNGRQKSKGFLVQAKIGTKLTNQSDFDDLHVDCKDMLRRSEASYVWIYESSGVRVVTAKEMLGHGLRTQSQTKRRRASTVFARTLECTEGDLNIGLPSVHGTRKTVRTALGEMLENLRIPRGIGVLIRDR